MKSYGSDFRCRVMATGCFYCISGDAASKFGILILSNWFFSITSKIYSKKLGENEEKVERTNNRVLSAYPRNKLCFNPVLLLCFYPRHALNGRKKKRTGAHREKEREREHLDSARGAISKSCALFFPPAISLQFFFPIIAINLKSCARAVVKKQNPRSILAKIDSEKIFYRLLRILPTNSYLKLFPRRTFPTAPRG